MAIAKSIIGGEEREKRNAYARQWRRDNPARAKDLDLRKYGTSLAAYDAMLEAQSGKCAICKEEPKTTLAVDHCHETRAVRGLLCHRCNRGLGYFKDNPLRLKGVIAYLKRAAKGGL